MKSKIIKECLECGELFEEEMEVANLFFSNPVMWDRINKCDKHKNLPKLSEETRKLHEEMIKKKTNK